MHRIFIAGIISVSIAITALSANSAEASDRGTTNFLAGLAGLAIFGAIIHESQKKKKKAKTYSAHDEYVFQPKHQKGHIKRVPDHRTKDNFAGRPRYKGHGRHQPKAKPLPHRVSRKLLPGNCLRSINTRHGQKRIFGNRCLNNNFRHVNKLPAACYTEFRSKGRQHHGYGARCLRSKGYSIARN